MYISTFGSEKGPPREAGQGRGLGIVIYNNEVDTCQT